MHDAEITTAVRRLTAQLAAGSDPLLLAASALAVWAAARRVADDQVATARRQGRTWAEVGAPSV